MEFVAEMLNIRFRGIEVGTKIWREGSLVRLAEATGDVLYIVDKQNNYKKVYIASVGLGSGELDICGKEMFVGDIVRKTIINERGELKSWDLVVGYSRGIILLGSTSLGSAVSQVKPPRLEIIGNRIV